MDESIKLPVGYRFNPYEEELISLYLKPKVLGHKLPCNVVEERQLYGPNANPWQLFDVEKHSWIVSEVGPGKFEKVTYVFVNLTKKAAVERKNKVGRVNTLKKAGCGTWSGKLKLNEIKNWNSDVVGVKRFLVFEINEVCGLDLSKVGYWKMHEYHLCGVNKNIPNPGNTVLCKITFDCSKSPVMRLRTDVDEDHLVKSSGEHEKKNTNVDSVSLPATMNCGTFDGNQGVTDNYGEGISTETCRDDSAVSDSYRDKGEEGDYGAKIVEICDGVECMDSSHVEEDIVVIPSSPSEQVDIGYLKPVASDFSWPAKFDNDLRKIKKEGGRGDLHFGMTKIKPEPSDFLWPGTYDNDYQKIENEEGRIGDLHFGMSKVQFSGYPKPKEEQYVEDTTKLGKRKLEVETLGTTTKKLCPVTVIIDE